MQAIDNVINKLPKQFYIESCAYEPQRILSIIQNIKNRHSDAFIFEANLKKTEENQSSYTVIAFKKLLEVQYDHQHTHLISSQEKLTINNNPINILKKLLSHYSEQQINLKKLHAFFPFLIGRVSYDFVSFTEPACNDIKKNNFLPIKAAIYQHYLFFDHDKKISSFISIGDSKLSSRVGKEAQASCPPLLSTSQGGHDAAHLCPPYNSPQERGEKHKLQFSTDVSDQQFASMIEIAKKHIIDGDIFQIVLSRNFYYPIDYSSFYAYRALREISDAAFLFYFSEDQKDYLGASPEKLVSVKDSIIEVCPLAGTRKRIHSLVEKFIEEELLNDEKENAEHMMLVDLARNDVGMLAKVGSVFVNKLKQLKKYSHVMHLSSSVKGVLKDNADSFDALMKCFPAGTLTGAPKIRAIQLIDQLELSSRNFYGGAIFLMDLEQNIESCIAIRMAEISENVAKIRTGAGIVFDSESHKEILETKNKASLLLHAFMLAKEYAYDTAD